MTAPESRSALRDANVGPRHVATAAAAILLLIASRLALTRRGTGSATASIDMLALGSGLGDDLVRTVATGSAAVLALGVVLGIAVVVPGRAARTVWSFAAIVVLLAGLVGFAALRSRSGPAVAVVALAGLLLVTVDVTDRRQRRPVTTR